MVRLNSPNLLLQIVTTGKLTQENYIVFHQNHTQKRINFFSFIVFL